jgi:predicted RNA binding protein YcfA (HicA-like mRNA interferase family)/predicted RNase H-like HicB family nuclease
MKPRDVIRILEADGWRELRTKRSHKQFRHPTKPGKVTVPVHGGHDIKSKDLASIERQSGIKLRKEIGMAIRYYPALITQDEGDGPDDGYGVVFPDLPGCVSVGDTVQQAAESAAEALALHLEGMIEDREDVPSPSAPDAPLPAWLADAAGTIAARVLIPVEMPGRIVRANITLDAALLGRLDAAAAAQGMSRSGFIAEAVRERLRG